MLLHTLQMAQLATVGVVELCADPAPGDVSWQGVSVPPGVCWSAQGAGDLGRRMASAAQRSIAAGEAVLLIGSDCPEMNTEDLRSAARALQSHDAVMAPTTDGGYALLGLNRFHTSVFEGVPWSTNLVAAHTLARLAAAGCRVSQLRTLHDIDDPADLRWLPPDWAP